VDVTEAELTPWIDVSVTVRQDMPHWPDNPPVVLERTMDIGRGDECNVSHLAIGVHSGTHMDGPVRFFLGAAGLDTMPLAATMGEARVVEIADPSRITVDELRERDLRVDERILFRTLNSERCWQSETFVEDSVYI
jgi:arylformamidase